MTPRPLPSACRGVSRSFRCRTAARESLVQSSQKAAAQPTRQQDQAIRRTWSAGRPHELVLPAGVVLDVFGVFAVDGAHLAQRAVLRHEGAGKEAGEYFQGTLSVGVGQRVVECGGVEARVRVVAAVGCGEKVSEGALACAARAAAAEKHHVLGEMGEALDLGRIIHLTAAYRHGNGSYKRAGVADNKRDNAVGQREAAVLPVIDEWLSDITAFHVREDSVIEMLAGGLKNREKVSEQREHGSREHRLKPSASTEAAPHVDCWPRCSRQRRGMQWMQRKNFPGCTFFTIN